MMRNVERWKRDGNCPATLKKTEGQIAELENSIAILKGQHRGQFFGSKRQRGRRWEGKATAPGGYSNSTISTQHKRPQRRYKEIERIYKCGWNRCEKSYSKLTHLNTHVTTHSHGQKRIPKEFKEIRRE
jgi:hypothetical protein